MTDKIKQHKSKKTSDNGMNKLDAFDTYDLDGLDFDDELDSSPRKPGVRGIGKEFLSSAKEGFKEDIVKNLIKKSLPDEFETYSSELSDLSYFANDTFDKSKAKLKRPIARIAKEAKHFLPERMTTLNKWMDKIIEKTDTDKQYQYNEDQARNSQITGEIGNIFNKQLEVQKALAARTEVNADVDRKLNLTSVKKSQELLSEISASASTSTSFSLQIAKEFYKKSLELQFRSYYVQADTLKSIKEFFPIYRTQFDAIIKNSGLPDYVKIKMDEKYFEVARTQMITEMNSKLMSNNAFLNNVKKNITRMVSNKVDDIADKLHNVGEVMGGIRDAGDMDKAKGKAGIIVNLMGNMGGGEIAKWIGKKFGDKVKPILEKSTTVNTIKNATKTFATSPQVFFSNLTDVLQKNQDKLEDDGLENKGGLITKLKRAAKKGVNKIGLTALEATRQGPKDDNLNKENILTTKTPAVFDQLIYRSVTHVIPLYLANIHKENKRLTDKFILFASHNVKSNKQLVGKLNTDDTEVMEYDYNSRKLSTKKDIQKNYGSFMEKKSVGDKTGAAAKGIVSGIQGLNTNKKKEYTESLTEYLKAATQAIPKSEQTFDNLLGETTNKAMLDLRKSIPNIEEALKAVKDSSSKDLSSKRTIQASADSLIRSDNNEEIKELFSLINELSKKLDIQTNGKGLQVKDILITDEECIPIDFSLTRSVLTDKQPLTVLRLGEAFKYVVNNKILINKIILMLAIVKVINTKLEHRSNFTFQITTVLAKLNTKIVNSTKIDPEYVRTVFGINPGVFDFDKISSNITVNLMFNDLPKGQGITNFKQLVTGKNLIIANAEVLADTIQKSSEQVFKEQLIDVGGKIGAYVKLGLVEGSKFIDNTKIAMNEFKSASGDPKKQAAILNKHINSVSDTLYKAADKVKSKAVSSVNEIGSSLGDLTEKAKGKLINKINKSIEDIEKLISEKEGNVKQVTDLETSFSDAINSNLKTGIKVEAIQAKFIKKEIELLKTMSEEMKKLVNKLSNTTINKESLKENYTSIREGFAKAIEGFKNKLKTFNDIKEQYLKAQEEVEKAAEANIAQAEAAAPTVA